MKDLSSGDVILYRDGFKYRVVFDYKLSDYPFIVRCSDQSVPCTVDWFEDTDLPF